MQISRVIGIGAALTPPRRRSWTPTASAQSGEPIKIGYSMALTGGLGAQRQVGAAGAEDLGRGHQRQGRPARAAGQARLLRRPEQSLAVPGIYTKLLDVDKVDLIIGGYATNMLAPAMPMVMQRKKIFIGLLGSAVNAEFNYTNYFAMIPSGPEPEAGLHPGLLRRGDGAEPEARRRSRSSRPTRNSPATPPTARARTPRRAASRSSTTRPIRRRRPTSRRSCARSRRPIPTSSSSAPIRPTRSAWCAPSTRSASSRR